MAKKSTKRGGSKWTLVVLLLLIVVFAAGIMLAVMEAFTPYKPSNGFKPPEQTEQPKDPDKDPPKDPGKDPDENEGEKPGIDPIEKPGENEGEGNEGEKPGGNEGEGSEGEKDAPQEAELYTVSFESGHFDAVGESPESKKYPEGAPVSLPFCPFTVEGYVFAGWNDGTATYSGAIFTMPSHDVIFTAQWEAEVVPVYYKVNYVKGEEGVLGTAPDEREYAAGTAFYLSSNPFTLDGYEFNGWQEGGEVYKQGAKYTMPERDVTFVATWKEYVPPVLYTVTYEAGSEDVTGNLPAPQQYAEGTRFYLASSYFDLKGYDFAGWHDGDRNYSAQSDYVMPAHNVTFTAQWVAKPPEPDHENAVFFEDLRDGFTVGYNDPAHAALRKEYEAFNKQFVIAEGCTCGWEKDYYCFVIDSIEYSAFESQNWREDLEIEYSGGKFTFRFQFTNTVSEIQAWGNVMNLEYTIDGYEVFGSFYATGYFMDCCGAIRIYMGVPQEELDVRVVSGDESALIGASVRGPNVRGNYVVRVEVGFGYSVGFEDSYNVFTDCGGGVFKAEWTRINEIPVVLVEKDYDFLYDEYPDRIVFEDKDGQAIATNVYWGVNFCNDDETGADGYLLDFRFDMPEDVKSYTQIEIYCERHGELYIQKAYCNASGGLVTLIGVGGDCGFFSDEDGSHDADSSECVWHVVLK